MIFGTSKWRAHKEACALRAPPPLATTCCWIVNLCWFKCIKRRTLLNIIWFLYTFYPTQPRLAELLVVTSTCNCKPYESRSVTWLITIFLSYNRCSAAFYVCVAYCYWCACSVSRSVTWLITLRCYSTSMKDVTVSALQLCFCTVLPIGYTNKLMENFLPLTFHRTGYSKDFFWKTDWSCPDLAKLKICADSWFQ